MKVFIQFLKLYGLKDLIASTDNNKTPDEIIIDLDESGNLRENYSKNNPRYRKWYIRNILNYAYYLFIFLILLFPIVHVIVMASVQLDTIYLELNIFRLLFICQWFCGVYYYQTNHFRQFISNNSKNDFRITIMFLIALCFTLLLICLYILLVIFDVPMNYYNELYKTSDSIAGKVFICILISLDTFYSYNIFLSNMIIISYAIYENCHELNMYSNKLDEYVINTTQELTIDSIIKDYTELKLRYSEIINNMNFIFSSMEILGLISCYFILIYITDDFTGINNYVEVCTFLIVTLIYISSMSKVKTSIGNIVSTVHKPEFFSLFLTRVKFNSYDELTHQNQHRRLNPRLPAVLNMENDKGDIIDSSGSSNQEIYNIDKTQIDLIKDLCMRSMIKGHEIGAVSDWTILLNKLGEEWDKFNVLGFEIDDTVIIQKLVVIVTGLLMILNVNITFLQS